MSMHLNDVGTIIKVRIFSEGQVLDISEATSMMLYLKKPSGTVLNKTPVFITDGSDGWMQYVTVAGDIDETGEWGVQAWVSLPDGAWYTDVQTVYVFTNLPVA